MTVRVPAKINLELRVGGPRADGFHGLATVFQAVDLVDDVTLTLIDAEPGTVQVTVSGAGAEDVPTDGTNLAARAVRMVSEASGVDEAVAVHIDKRIPVAGGMAGGSADGAAALLAADALWHAGLGMEELHALAARLGSDVPFALHGGTAVGTGRGEVLAPALVRGEYVWVLAVHRRGLSTPSVFAETDRLRQGRDLAEPEVSQELMKALGCGDAAALGTHLANDLQPAACSLLPDLELVLDAGHSVDALGALVSGSGPTVAFLARDAEHALDIEAALGSVSTLAAVHRATGPVPGAKVVSTRPLP